MIGMYKFVYDIVELLQNSKVRESVRGCVQLVSTFTIDDEMEPILLELLTSIVGLLDGTDTPTVVASTAAIRGLSMTDVSEKLLRMITSGQESAQRDAVKAIRSIGFCDEGKIAVRTAGWIPVLVRLLISIDDEVVLSDH